MNALTKKMHTKIDAFESLKKSRKRTVVSKTGAARAYKQIKKK